MRSRDFLAHRILKSIIITLEAASFYGCIAHCPAQHALARRYAYWWTEQVKICRVIQLKLNQLLLYF